MPARQVTAVSRYHSKTCDGTACLRASRARDPTRGIDFFGAPPCDASAIRQCRRKLGELTRAIARLEDATADPFAGEWLAGARSSAHLPRRIRFTHIFAMNEHPIFSVTNHHVEGCGKPPQIDDSTRGRYRGYFENEHGEQTIFVYDRAARTGTLYMGDAGWEHPYQVVDGAVPGLSMNGNERMWLAACWKAATRS